MREIKFRGRTPKGEWLYGDLQQWSNGDVYIGTQNEMWPDDGYPHTDYLSIAKVNENTVGQFTGLHDKNGKEIYEGDIVRFNQKFLIENILRVGYEYSHRGGFSLCTKEGYYGMFGDAWLEPFYCEVIGNIHDNSELLKGGER